MKIKVPAYLRLLRLVQGGVNKWVFLDSGALLRYFFYAVPYFFASVLKK